MATATLSVAGTLPGSWQRSHPACASIVWWQIWQPRGGSKVRTEPELLR